MTAAAELVCELIILASESVYGLPWQTAASIPALTSSVGAIETLTELLSLVVQGLLAYATKVNTAPPFARSLGPGLYTELKLNSLLKIPSPDVNHLIDA